MRYVAGDIANLVHELTHISVNEAFDQDFVNYLNPAAGVTVPVPARNLGPTGFAANTADRELSWRHGAADKERWLLEMLRRLDSWADDPELLPENIRQVKEKLRYGMTNVTKEYDPVINQILVWLHNWGLVQGNVFYDKVAAAVFDAHLRRKSNLELNTALPLPVDKRRAPLPPPAAPAHHRRCFITTACINAKGLMDNCDELTTLRSFRDNYVMTLDEGETLIQEYYQMAPLIISSIQSQDNSREILEGIYTDILNCVNLIKREQNEKAVKEYIKMVQDLKARYINR